MYQLHLGIGVCLNEEVFDTFAPWFPVHGTWPNCFEAYAAFGAVDVAAAPEDVCARPFVRLRFLHTCRINERDYGVCLIVHPVEVVEHEVIPDNGAELADASSSFNKFS